MPRIRTPASITARYLYSGNQSDLERQTGIIRRTLWNRRNKDPGATTLREFGALIKANGLDDEEILEIVRAWEL